MKFHLNYSPKKSDFEINHNDSLFLIGSCFAENIGQKLKENKFNTLINPNGILFNPISILNGLNSILEQKSFDEKYILQRDQLYYSYLHHSSFHSDNKELLVDQINRANQEAFQFLKQSGYLFITFGTAFVYEHQTLQQVIGNCHKQPQSAFRKRMTEIEEIVKLYSILIPKLKQINPNLKIIFTVSPVKYLKDGIEANNLSKSVLSLSIHKLLQTVPDCNYFPAYELVNDDLRDYRFYKEDMAHPNEQAIDYVWQKFSACFFNEQTQQVNSLLKNLNKALSHQPLTDDANTHAQLLDYLDKQKAKIHALIPDLVL